MQQLIVGQKCKVNDVLKTDCFSISAEISVPESEVDVSLIGIDKNGKLSDERYFIFYNQLASPEGAVKKHPSLNTFELSLSLLPDYIDKLVLTAAIDGEKAMKNLNQSKIIFGGHIACYEFDGKEFQNEKAIILVEFYRYQGNWRIAIVGRGFDGGLSALLAHFAGEEAKEEPKQESKPISLKKSEKVNHLVLEKAPHLVDLTKKAIVTLEKKKLMDIRAQVVLVLDTSGSMSNQYKKGKVQRILDKVLPLALLFDDDGKLESWAFATRFRHLTDATVDNIRDYVVNTDGGWKKWDIGGTNNEPLIMEQLYHDHKDSTLPVYIIFISDGGVNQNREIRDIIKKASYGPLFWQFVGIHGRNYGALIGLDHLEGRFIDNANFFALDDIDSISDEELYDKLMNEFPIWLKKAQEKGILK